MTRSKVRQKYHTLPDSESVSEKSHDEWGIQVQSFAKEIKTGATDCSTSSLIESHEEVPRGLRHLWRARWRIGVLAVCLLVLLFLILNVVVAGWIASHATFRDGTAELYLEDCAKVRSIDTYVHLAINIMSTLVLSGGSYTMQVLAAPTRSEIDRAHARGNWLDIAVPSVRNLTKISSIRTTLWIILALSVIPLHLVFNSSFYSTIATNDCNVLIASEAFLNGTSFSIDHSTTSDTITVKGVQTVQSQVSSYERLSNTQCINAYARDIVNDRRNLVVISSNHTANNSLLYVESHTFRNTFDPRLGFLDSGSWICRDPATLANSHQNGSNPNNTHSNTCQLDTLYTEQYASQWAPLGYKAEYCLSEKVSAKCSFNSNMAAMITVIVCNAITVSAILFVVFFLRSKPLLVIGDAIQSFLDVPDETTQQLCLLSRDYVVDGLKSNQQQQASNKATRILPRFMWLNHFSSFSPSQRKQVWPVNNDLHPTERYQLLVAHSSRKRWYSAPSGRRWLFTFLTITSCVVVILGLLIFSLMRPRLPSASALYPLGFGDVSSQTIMSDTDWTSNRSLQPSQQINAAIIVANSPQLLLSLLYLTTNSLLTVMFTAAEWSSFAFRRRTLRVSDPRGDQRSTYYLQLPYHMVAPLIMVSTLLHWLASRSVFLAAISEWDVDGNLVNALQAVTYGYSPLSMLTLLILSGLVLVVLIALSFRRYTGFMPLAAGCSAAISAACHIPETEEEDAVLKPLQWGVVKEWEARDEDGEAVAGHCCFSSEKVTAPEDGRVYTGMRFC